MNNPCNVYCESGKGSRNLTNALEAQLRDINIRGKNVLLKPNMVDPDIPEACSNPASLQVIVDALSKHGAKEIFMGDEPASYYFDAVKKGHFDLKSAYKAVGYDKIKGVTLIDLRKLPKKSFKAVRIDPATAGPVHLDVPVRDMSGTFVVSTTLPKHHGNFNYTGVTKNLMGLVPQEDRMNNFHYNLWSALEAEWNKGNTGITLSDMIESFALRYARNSGATRFDTSRNFIASAYNQWKSHSINDESMAEHIDHIVNAFSIVGLAAFARSQSKPGLYILDGAYTMEKHEHAGNLVKTDFAIVGQNPILVDTAALNKLGICITEIPYLAMDAPYQNGVNLQNRAYKVVGNLGASLPGKTLLDKELFQDSHGLTFLRVK